MLFPIHRAFLLVLPVLVACSGKVDVDQTSTGTGGTGGQGGTGGSDSACPAEPPVDGAPCDMPPDEPCSYGECCPRIFTCEAGSWVETLAGCAPPPACPQSPPLDGTACVGGPCGQTSPCTYACEQGGASFTVTCGDDNRWHSDMPALCNGAITCGDKIQCLEGYVCVVKQAFGAEYECVLDPCVPDPLSCACAESVCGDGFACIQASDKNVLCECPACK
ncbi:hypothetical protein [Polyangium sp. y55x31]|uniref:hypothetical protein n=1 Tax=Polyangium sp. y55x31 TaxID=3042688 RepID=UPI002482BE36|nr:hypothetical protein [Polyangium sp. y55x31]MDI1483819.1 hypothetical protein [Polyangium sp. y55x31]